jgi:hypothetical protein
LQVKDHCISLFPHCFHFDSAHLFQSTDQLKVLLLK